MNNNPKGGFLKSSVFYIFIFLAVVGMIYGLFGNDKSSSKTLTSSEFMKALNDKELKSITVQPGNGIYNVSGEYRTAQKTKADKGLSFLQSSQKVTRFSSTLLPNDASLKSVTQVASSTDTDMVTKQQESSGFWLNLLVSLIPVLLIVAVFYVMMSQAGGKGGQGGMMSFGKSKAKPSDPKDNKVRFSDVAGAEEEKQELVEVVEFLKSPKKFVNLGARIPKGVLLEGPPGTGKTLLAKAVAGEAGVPFFFISGSDFVEMFVGVGASRVRDLFMQGKKNAPCLIFIDEIDAVGRQRGAGLGGGHDEREQTLNQMLVEMDGFESNEGVILIAATNRPDVLDPALLRPGRFDRQVVVSTPDLRGRQHILAVHTKKTPIADDVNIEVLAKGTPGFSGADLENLVNEAALQAAKKNKNQLNMSDFEYAKDKVLMGKERRSLVLSDEEKRITAYHEAGHALAAMCLPGSDPVHKVSIIPRGRALGVTMQLPEEDRHGYSKNYLRNNLVVLLAGRMAEELVMDDITTGAGNDIERATKMARKMVCEWGMSDKVGLQAIGENNGEVFLGREWTHTDSVSQSTAQLVDSEIKFFIDEAHERCRKILEENMDTLHRIADALLERETITGDDIKRIMEGKELEPSVLDETKKADEKDSFTWSEESKQAVSAENNGHEQTENTDDKDN